MFDDIYKFKRGQLFKIEDENTIYKLVGWDWQHGMVVILAENIKTKEIFSFGYNNINCAPKFHKINSPVPPTE